MDSVRLSWILARRDWRAGELRLTGAFFAISDGVLHMLDEASGEFNAVE